MGDIAVRLGGSVIRDYDRPVRFSNSKCWICNATGRKALVEEATAEQCLIRKVPAGASLCAECAFLSDEELAEAERMVGETERLAHQHKVNLDRVNEFESEVENIRQWDREENLWGGA